MTLVTKIDQAAAACKVGSGLSLTYKMHSPHRLVYAAHSVHVMEDKTVVLAAGQQQGPRIEQRPPIEVQPWRLIQEHGCHSGGNNAHAAATSGRSATARISKRAGAQLGLRV